MSSPETVKAARIRPPPAFEWATPTKRPALASTAWANDKSRLPGAREAYSQHPTQQPASPSKNGHGLTHPANLRTKQRTRNTFKIYLKAYMSAPRHLILAGEGAVFGHPKSTSDAMSRDASSTSMADISTTSTLPSWSQAAIPSQDVPARGDTTQKRRKLSHGGEETPRARHPTSSTFSQSGAASHSQALPSSRTTTHAASSSHSTSTTAADPFVLLPVQAEAEADDEEVGFTRSFLERVPELAQLAAAIARVERHVRAGKASAGKDAAATKAAKDEAKPRTREEKESADRAAGTDILIWALRTLLEEGGIVLCDDDARVYAHTFESTHGASSSNAGASSSTSAAPSSTRSAPSTTSSANTAAVSTANFSTAGTSTVSIAAAGREDAFVVLTPALLRAPVRSVLDRRKGTELRAEDVLKILRRDERWRSVGLWDVKSAIEDLPRA